MTQQLSSATPGSQSKHKIAPQIIVVVLAYFVSARLGLAIPDIGSHITLIWLPTGIAVAALMHWGYRCWPGIFFGAVVANFSIDFSPLLDCCIALGNTLGPLLAADLLRRLKFHRVLDRPRDTLFLVVAAAAGGVVSASGGVSSLLAFKMLPGQDADAAWPSWWAGDFLGVLLLVPLLLNISRAEWRKLWAQRLEFLAWFSVLLVIGWRVFFLQNHGAFLMLPVIVWSAMRFGMMGSSLGVLFAAVIAAVASSLGLGPFYSVEIRHGLWTLWLFVATLVLVNLMVTAMQAKRKQADEVVQQNELRFRQMFERHSSIMLLIEPLSGVIEDANAAACHFYGYPLEHLIGMNITQINTQSPVEVTIERAQAMREERNYFIFPHRLANGEVRTVEVHSSPIEVAGHSVLFSIIHDITERQSIKEKTEALLRRYQTLLKTAMDGIYILDMQGNVVEANDAFCTMLGYSLEEMLTLNLMNLNAQYTPEQLCERLRGFIGKSARFETVHRCKSGRLIEVEISTSSVDIDGQYYFITSSRDISERKKIEQELQDSERTSRMLMNNAADAVFVADPIRERWVYINDRFESLLGYSREELLATPIYDLVTPEFRDIYRERFQSIAQAGGVATRELQLNRKDGSRVLLEMSAVTLPDGNVHGSCRDITARKKIEEGQRIAAVTFDTQGDHDHRPRCQYPARQSGLPGHYRL